MRSLGRLAAAVAVSAAALTALTACAEPEASSLCPAYAEFLDTLAALPTDLTAGTADDAADLVESVRAAADQLAAADDGRHSADLSALTTALDDLERTLRSFEPEADSSTWQDAFDDSADEVVDAAVALDEALAQECADEA